MTTLTSPTPSTFRRSSVVQDAPASRPGASGWLAEMQRKAWREFSSLPMPARKDETWRFADLAKLKFDHYHAAGEAPAEELVERSAGLEHSVARLVFANDALVHRDAVAGVEIFTLEEAAASGDAQLREAICGAMSELGSAKFVALHQAQMRNAAILRVPANSTVPGTIEIFHWQAGDNTAVFPRTIILAEENARVSVLEHHLSANGGPGFSCGMAQIFAARGARVTYVLSERRNDDARAIHLSRTCVAQDAHVVHCLADLGGAWTRTECVSHLTGEGARSDMLSISLTNLDEENDQRTLQLHEAPRTTSDLLYKNVLFGKSRTIFAGLIRVDDGAHFTDAYQKCRNLLMTDECEANSMPGLEINADQVKCSHGSTSGAISPEEIFYFASRGIPEEAARALLAQGFLGEVAERIGDAELAEFLKQEIERRFAQATAAPAQS